MQGSIRNWSETHRWSAWVTPASYGDAVEVGQFLTQTEAKRIVRENKQGGFTEETVVEWGNWVTGSRRFRWKDVAPGAPEHKMLKTLQFPGGEDAFANQWD